MSSSSFHSCRLCSSDDNQAINQDGHFNLISFLGAVQHFSFDFLPITWQDALEPLGETKASKISESLLNLQVSLAFKRAQRPGVSEFTLNNGEWQRIYKSLMAELVILAQPGLRNSANVTQLEGVCWEMSESTEEVLPVLVFEKANSKDLESFANSKDGRDLGFSERMAICSQIATGIKAMHSSRVAHADLKPANILVFQDHEGRYVPKLADFGYSVFFSREEQRHELPRSRPWEAPGSHHRPYTFPEALKRDTFSFGMICWWLIFHQTLFPTAAKKETLRDIFLDLAEDLKERGELLAKACEMVSKHVGLNASEKARLVSLFEISLCSDEDMRTSAIDDMDVLLQCEGATPRHVSSSSDFRYGNLNATDNDHPQIFSIQDSLSQLVRTDFRVRRGIFLALENVEKESPCILCRNSAALELALCSAIGFGGPTTGDNFERAQTDAIIRRVAEIKNDTVYTPFKSRKMAELDHSGALKAMDYAHEFRATGLLEVAERNASSELSCFEKALGSDHLVVYLLKTVLISIIKGQGDTRKSEPIEEGLVEALRRDPHFGPTHVLTLSTTNNLSFTYRDQCKWDKAEHMFKDVLEKFRQTTSDSHLLYLESLSNLAYVYEQMGKPKDAEALHLDVTTKRERILGSLHPSTILSKANLAKQYGDQGRWEECATLQRSALAASSKVVGDKHLNTLTLRMNLASTLHSMGRYEDSLEIEKSLYVDSRDFMGQDHFITSISMNNLASTYWKLNRFEEAEKMEKQMVAAFERTRGHDHLETIIATSNLADTLASREKWEEAEETQKELLERALRLFTNEHYITWVLQSKLATTYRLRKQWDPAERLESQALQSRRRYRGETHPETLQSMFNMAHILNGQGRLEAACGMMEETARLREQSIGAEHPHTRLSKRFVQQWRLEQARSSGVDSRNS